MYSLYLVSKWPKGEINETKLDKTISINEIKETIGNLKLGKSHDKDRILNEYFIEFKDYILPISHNFFNCILNTGNFPNTLSSSNIVPCSV